jgi:hypothetical protein
MRISPLPQSKYNGAAETRTANQLEFNSTDLGLTIDNAAQTPRQSGDVLIEGNLAAVSGGKISGERSIAVHTAADLPATLAIRFTLTPMEP